MAALSNPTLKKWLSFGSGCGIVLRDGDLEVTAVTLRPTGAQIAGTTRIERYAERPAVEWGAEYAKFLSSLGLRHVPALIVLPREEVIVRVLALPGVKDEDAGAAVRFQLDGLHPFPEGEAVADWKRVGSSAHFLVAIVERATLDRTVSLFSEAGVKMLGITVSASAIETALRRLGAPPAAGLVAACGLEGWDGLRAVEIYGESPSRPVYSGVFEMMPEQAAAVAVSELRLEPETELKDLLEFLPPLHKAPGDYDFSRPARSRGALAYAAALASACTHLGAPVNLLPKELRTEHSRARYIPTVALGVLLLGCAAALLIQGGYEDRKYYTLVKSESRKMEAPARRVAQSERDTQALLERIQTLDEFRARARGDLESLLALTRLVPQNSFATGMAMSRDQVLVGGEGDQTENLLKTLDSSPYFKGSELTTPLTRTQAGLEVFRIRTMRTKGVAR